MLLILICLSRECSQIPGQIRNSWIDPQKVVRLTVNGYLKSAVLNDTQAENKLALHSLTTKDAWLWNIQIIRMLNRCIWNVSIFCIALSTGERPRTDANNAYQVVSILADVEKRLKRRPLLGSISPWWSRSSSPVGYIMSRECIAPRNRHRRDPSLTAAPVCRSVPR